MIPFVAGGGLLMALGFLPFLGGVNVNSDDQAYDVVINNALWDAPCRGTRPVPRLGPVRDRSCVDGLPRPGAGRLHRVRDRRSAGHRSGIRRRCGGRADECGLHRRHRRRPAGRSSRLVARKARRAALAARSHAGRDHPAARIDLRLRFADPVPGPTDRDAHGVAGTPGSPTSRVPQASSSSV